MIVPVSLLGTITYTTIKDATSTAAMACTLEVDVCDEQRLRVWMVLVQPRLRNLATVSNSTIPATEAPRYINSIMSALSL